MNYSNFVPEWQDTSKVPAIIDSFAVKDENDICITNIIDEIPLRKYIMISKKNRYIPPQSIAFKELLFEFIPPKNCISLLP